MHHRSTETDSDWEMLTVQMIVKHRRGKPKLEVKGSSWLPVEQRLQAWKTCLLREDPLGGGTELNWMSKLPVEPGSDGPNEPFPLWPPEDPYGLLHKVQDIRHVWKKNYDCLMFLSPGGYRTHCSINVLSMFYALWSMVRKLAHAMRSKPRINHRVATMPSTRGEGNILIWGAIWS